MKQKFGPVSYARNDDGAGWLRLNLSVRSFNFVNLIVVQHEDGDKFVLVIVGGKVWTVRDENGENIKTTGKEFRFSLPRKKNHASL